ncbi:hypothetical protein DSM3645_26389 [Blastopirellula marina DSM 3645]|uniref:Gamma-glutamylcyclotransferase AIG2-like domain-containing protein n=1 Tax=Blastopirellula marina DSM 3645 TaxID=314230 RepID=A3ZWJ1_9BACT|nr:hypothetical protein DSM3645_26389 [Blastopirellula marina DSM 3645]
MAGKALSNLSSLCTAWDAVEYRYPWRVDELFASPSDRLSLIGYGSLMNLASARRSLNAECLASAQPVVVFGARRVYEYVMSPTGRRVYGEVEGEQRFGVLNAQATGDRADWFNGMMFQIGADDIPALLSRESAYDLLPAWTLAWEDDTPRPQIAYFFSCRQKTFAGRQTIDSQILPHPRYHEICESGCLAISHEFLHAFRTTTWVRQSRLIDSADRSLVTV